ncbi:MAG: response regulator [Acidobacteria bacterium]|nr:response regulator [Acidobacteriota bacterium]
MPKILYVEDNPINYKLVEKVLTRAGHEVIGAADGLTAIRVACEQRPDLILMDINLPSLSGYEVTTRIKSIEGLEDIPIVALTARTMKGDRDMALATGCIGFIPKPLDLQTFVQDVDSYLSGRCDTIAQAREPVVLREYSRQLVSNLEEKVSALHDINWRLQESEERYRQLVDNVNIGIWFLSSQRRTIFLNQKMRDLLAMDEFEPSTLDLFLDEPGQNELLLHLTLCSQGIPQLWETSLRTQQNQTREVVVSGVSVRSWPDEKESFLLSFTDVTEKNRLKRRLGQIQKLESMSTLTAGVAHDFNNILAIIQHNIMLLLNRPDITDKDFHQLQSIASAAERGVSLTSQLLAFSRETPANMELLDPVEAVRRFCEFFGNYKNSSIELSGPPVVDVPPIQADPTQLEQVLLNLATNAQDAMPEGGVIRFGVRPALQMAPEPASEGEPGDYVCIRVRDSGVGIDPALQERIFEPFFTTKAADKGTGLGLSAVFGIVQKHNGFVRVESTVGQGTEFQVYLPVAEGTVPAIPTDDGQRLRQGQYVALVVDDDELVLDVLVEMVADLGVTVHRAGSMTAARGILDRDGARLDFMCLDYQQPDLDLHALLIELRRNLPQVRVILMSGYSLAEIREREGDIAVDAFLKKPFTMQTLLESFVGLL